MEVGVTMATFEYNLEQPRLSDENQVLVVCRIGGGYDEYKFEIIDDQYYYREGGKQEYLDEAIEWLLKNHDVDVVYNENGEEIASMKITYHE